MLGNFAEVLNTAVKAFLEEQQGMGTCRFDCLLIGLSIVAFAKMFASNRKFANHHYIARHQQMISGTNQLLSLKNKESKDLPGSASIPTLEHHTYRAVLLVPPLAMQARDAAGANAANMIKILSKLFYTINIQELFWTRPKPSQQDVISRSSSHHIENKIETK